MVVSPLDAVVLSHASVFGGSGQTAAVEPGPAERIRQLLDQPLTLDYNGVSLQEVTQHLREKTRVNWVLDQFAVHQVGLGPDVPLVVTLKSDRSGKLRTAVQRMLNAYNLTFVILEDSVLITTEEIALSRQMRQRVSVSYTNTPVNTALKDLARDTAINLIFDPRLGREADAKVSLQLEGAGLESTVRILAEMANLKSVRMGNVLFITNEVRADKLRCED